MCYLSQILRKDTTFTRMGGMLDIHTYRQTDIQIDLQPKKIMSSTMAITGDEA